MLILYVVARMLQASWGRSGEKQQEQPSQNHVWVLFPDPVLLPGSAWWRFRGADLIVAREDNAIWRAIWTGRSFQYDLNLFGIFWLPPWWQIHATSLTGLATGFLAKNGKVHKSCFVPQLPLYPCWSHSVSLVRPWSLKIFWIIVDRAWLMGGPQVWCILFLLMPTSSAWLCLQHSHNLGTIY